MRKRTHRSKLDPTMGISIKINERPVTLEADPSTPLLWVLRDTLGLTGTKFGCGVGACGSCTVHIDGRAVRSCVVPLAAAADKAITTIEGLRTGDDWHPVQRAWIDEQVPQCGYCQSGMIMATAALLRDNAKPTDDDIDEAITNICRCGTYPRIRRAIHRAADRAHNDDGGA
jgi:isoquinoline 1-oxidoreductase alpha subunit